MKVCHITNYLPGYHNHSGGAEQACLKIARLTEDDVSISFITTKHDNESKDNLKVYAVNSVEKMTGKLIGKYVEVVKWYKWQKDPIVTGAVRDILEKEKPDLVHFHNFQFMTLSLIEMAKKMGFKTCLSIYDYWYFCPLTSLIDHNNKICRRFHGVHCIECLPKMFRFVQKFLLKYRKKTIDHYLKFVDHFIVLSKSSESILCDYGISNDKISVIPLTILKYSEDKVSIKEEDKSILYAGWIQHRKGLHILLQAMPEVIEKYPKVKLYAMGGAVKFADDYENTIKDLIEKKNLSNNVDLMGMQKPETVKEYLHRCNMVVIPEQWENMSPVLVAEAMTLGRPIVASRIGGIPEFIDGETNGLLATHDDPHDFAKKIITCLDDPEKARKMGEKAKSDSKIIFDENNIKEKLLNLYKKLLND